jgi:hypothetical protein
MANLPMVSLILAVHLDLEISPRIFEKIQINPSVSAVLRIRDVYPGSWILSFTHPRSRIQNQQQKRGVKKICCHTILCSHKIHKIVNYFSFKVLKKKIWANFQRIIELFTQKIVTKLYKIWVWDPRSGIRKKPIPDPGSGSATLCFRGLGEDDS